MITLTIVLEILKWVAIICLGTLILVAIRVITEVDEDKPIATRYNDTSYIHCHNCSWHGMVKDTYHDYTRNGSDGDVEPVDKCPKCKTIL